MYQPSWMDRDLHIQSSSCHQVVVGCVRHPLNPFINDYSMCLLPSEKALNRPPVLRRRQFKGFLILIRIPEP